MKITGQKPPNLAELSAGKTQEKGVRTHVERLARESRETAGVSKDISLAATKIKETLRAEPDIRPDRVEEVKEKIRSGKYQVDPERLAENLLTASLREDLEKS